VQLVFLVPEVSMVATRPGRCRASVLLFAALSAAATTACRTPDTAARVDDARLVAADQDSANWLTYGRTYSEQRFSPLRLVSDSNVGRLGLVWSRELPTTRGLEATPIVLDGVLYTTSSWSVVYAFRRRHWAAALDV
jgi:quinohemoprotein ethanol dehydrogenase